MLVNIALVQHTVGTPVGLDLKLHLFRQRADFICFPEYWGAETGMADLTDLSLSSQHQIALMTQLSADLQTTIIAGTTVIRGARGLQNSSTVIASGRVLGQYEKMHPTPTELQRGIVPGSGPVTWSQGTVTFGIAICADCLQPATFQQYADLGVDILFVPNASPLRPGESVEEKFARDDEIFVDGARRLGGYVVKVCGVGAIFGHPLQGRSLIAAPWGVLNRVPATEESRPQVLSVRLSTDELHAFRRRLRLSGRLAG